ncbi:MAG: site-2 protease family protein [Candidatus Paceibacterota bacterium]|jgi:regulator of sigma E protease
MTVVLFLIVLAVLIFVHELGHFVSAKMFGIRVDEFAIGFPPRVFGWKSGETQYSLNLIPLGGFVKIFGEDPDDDSMTGPDSKRSFVNAAKWKQIVVLLSGILMNIIFAWILISVSFNFGLLTSVEEQYKDKAQNVSVMVLSVLKDSPSEQAGLKEGDNILSIESGKTKIVSPIVVDIQKTIAESKNNIIINYKRGNATGTVSIVARDGIVEGKKAIGISMGLVGTVKFGFFQSFVEGAKLTAIETINITKGIYSFIGGAFSGKSGLLSQVTGPVGIASMVGQAKNMGISYLLGFIAMISINLAMLNLVPFPALDGGRVLFVLIEVIIRRKIKPVIANLLNLIGFALLISLMLFITYKDILKLFK